GGGAAEEKQQVPSEQEGLFEVVRQPRGLGDFPGALHIPRGIVTSRHRHPRPQSSPARFEVASASMMSRISQTRSTNGGCRSISLGGRSGGGTSISRRIVPGDDEKT